jgi:hypothetical protein
MKPSIEVAREFANMWELGERINSDLFIADLASLLDRERREATNKAVMECYKLLKDVTCAEFRLRNSFPDAFKEGE